VLIGGRPAARITDKLVCACPAAIDIIATGEPTVLIGTSARAIAFIVGPDGQHWIRFGDNIWIKEDPNNPSYGAQALAALVRLDNTPNMHAAIDAIQASGKQMIIQPYVPPPGWGPYNAYCQPNNYNDALPAGVNGVGTGLGTGSTVAWNPEVNGFGPAGTTGAASQPGGDVILGHEMIHGTHNATGTHGNGPTNADGIQVGEERNTVGLPPRTYQNPSNPADPLNGTAMGDTRNLPYTENGLRQDYRNQGMPSPVTGNPPTNRPSYYPPGHADTAGGPT